MRLAACAVLAACLPALAGADTAADTRAARQLESVLGGLKALRAEFRQSVTDAQGRLTESAEGTVTLARPGRFRWDYRDPKQLIVSDGTTVWLYDVDLAQVTIRPAADALVGTPAQLLSGPADLQAAFEIADGGFEDGLTWYRLVPKDASGDFRELRTGIAGGELRRLVLVDRLGQTTRLEFDHIERNPRMDDSDFRLDPPEGVDVIGRAPAGGA